MSDQPAPLDPKEITDLQLAELIAQTSASLSQNQINMMVLQAELQRRKALLVETS